MNTEKIYIKDSKYFLFSKFVKVFPCSYRGYQEGTAQVVFDPEARMNTEYNFIHSAALNNISDDSYIISWEQDTQLLKCVIGGYYFELDIALVDLDNTLKYLNIELETLTINNAEPDSARTTKILKSQYTTESLTAGEQVSGSTNDDLYLDKKVNSNDYIFSGLTLSESAIPGYISLQISDGEKIFEASYLPSIKHGTGENSIIIGENNSAGGKNSLAAGYNVKAEKANEIVVGQYSKDPNWYSKSARNPVFVVGNGKKNQTTGTIEQHDALIIGQAEFHDPNYSDISIYGKTNIDGNIKILTRDDAHSFDISSTAGNTGNPGTGSIEAITDEFKINIGNISSNKARILVHNKNISGDWDDKKNNDIILSGETWIKATGGQDHIAVRYTTSGTSIDDTSGVELSSNIATAKIAVNGYKNEGKGEINISAGKNTIMADDNNKISVSKDTGIAIIGNNTGVAITGSASTITAESFTVKTADSGEKAKLELRKDGQWIDAGTYHTRLYGYNTQIAAEKTDGTIFENAHQIKLVAYKSNGTDEGAKVELCPEGAVIDNKSYDIGIIGNIGVAGNLTISEQLTVQGLPNKCIIGTDKDGKIVSHDSYLNTYTQGYLTLTNDSQHLVAYGLGTSDSPEFSTVLATNVVATNKIEAKYFNATSDARLKENIKEYDCEKSILNLPIYKYDFINGKKNQIGCLAQDLQKICPELVEEGKDGYLNIQENKLVYLLLQEVKQLKYEIAKIERN